MAVFQYTYLSLLFYFLDVIIIVFLVLGIAFLFSRNDSNFEKLSAYECGYEAFNDTQQEYDIRYFLIGLLFIIFDIELMFLFPWIISLSFSGNFIFWVGIDFLIELALSFILAWYLYIFDWK